MGLELEIKISREKSDILVVQCKRLESRNTDPRVSTTEIGYGKQKANICGAD